MIYLNIRIWSYSREDESHLKQACLEMENLHCKRKDLRFWTVCGIHMRKMKLSYIIKPFKNIKICCQYVVLDNNGVSGRFPKYELHNFQHSVGIVRWLKNSWIKYSVILSMYSLWSLDISRELIVYNT